MSALEEPREATFSWTGSRELAMGLYTHLSGLWRMLDTAGYGKTSLTQEDVDPKAKESDVQITFTWRGPQRQLYNVVALLNALRQMIHALQEGGLAQISTGEAPTEPSGASGEEQVIGALAEAG